MTEFRINQFTGELDKVRSDSEIEDIMWVLPPIIEWYDPTGGLPVDPDVGDRYGADETANGWTQDYIYEWDGTEWVEESPEEGWMIWDLLGLIFWVFFSGGWMEEGSLTYVPYTGATTDVDLGVHDLTTTGDYHVGLVGLSDTASGASGCSLIGIPALSGATWTNQCEFDSLFGSAGRATGGVISDNGGGTVAVTAGTGFIKATDSDTAELLSFDWVANNSVSITDDVTWVGVKYNIGSPEIYTETSIYNFDLDTEFPLGAVYRETVNGGYTYCVMNSPWWVTDGTTNILERIYAQGKVVYDRSIGGMAISNPATTKLAITSGKLWVLLNEFSMTAINTSVPTGSFWYMYYKSVDGWTLDNAATDYSVAQWNDTTQNALQNLNNNKYANIWVYACPGVDRFVLLYPQAQYNTSAGAEAESPPTLLPKPLAEDGILVGRMLIQEGVDAPIEIQSAFDTQFTPAQATDHGNLAGLSDDDHMQYLLADGTRALAGAWSMGDYALTNVNIDTGNIANAVVNTEWDLAYDHSIDNSQAHSDYLINNGSDSTTGILTASGFITANDVQVGNDLLFPNSASIINWGSGEITLTNTNANLLTMAGGTLCIVGTAYGVQAENVILEESFNSETLTLKARQNDITGNDGSLTIDTWGDDVTLYVQGTLVALNQDLRDTASPSFAGLTVLSGVTFGSLDLSGDTNTYILEATGQTGQQSANPGVPAKDGQGLTLTTGIGGRHFVGQPGGNGGDYDIILGIGGQGTPYGRDGVFRITGRMSGIPDEITATSAGVAASISTINTEVTTNGDSDLDNVTLANGLTGQIKHIYCVVEGNASDTWKITPATMCGGTQITFAGVGEGCTLVYADSEGWVVTANNGGTIT